MIDNIGYIATYSGGNSLLLGKIEFFSSACRMGIVGEMPITLSSRKGSDTEPDPYEEWLKWKKEQEYEQKEKENELLKEEK